MNDDKISTFTCALAGLGVIGLATVGCWAWCRKDEISIGALVGGSDEIEPITVDYMGPGDVLISNEDLHQWLARHPGWRKTMRPGSRYALARAFSFDSPASESFKSRLDTLANQYNHHPEMDVRPSGKNSVTVRVGWISHDVGGITSRDTQMAERTDALAR